MITRDVVGIYDGTYTVYLGILPIATGKQNDVIITKVANDSVSLSLKNFMVNIGGGDIPLGDISMKHCHVTIKNNTYTIKGKREFFALSPPIGDCWLTPEGTVVNGVANMTINIIANIPTPGTTLRVSYKGTRKETEP
ncbi:MAG: calycin-like domain-containing protein [Mediterranea sp.]|nr:calycin-like domain-containing protein [Mediterranea sp.]